MRGDGSLRFRMGQGLSALIATWAISLALSPAAAGAQEVTFTRDVAPILYENCVECHRPGSFAPMSLLTYENARFYAPLMKFRVQMRQMPPWHVDRTVGIQDYENDASLTDEEIATIVRWVDGGALMGDAEDMPPLPDLPEGGAWQLEEQLGRPPDMIVRSAEYDVIANGQDQWWAPMMQFEGLDEPAMDPELRVQAGVPIRHEGRPSRSHQPPLRGSDPRIAHYGVGKRYETFPEGIGMLVPVGEAQVSWNIHYFPMGERVENDVIEVGLWFYPKGEEPEIETRGEVLMRVDRRNGMPRGGDILIPPPRKTGAPRRACAPTADPDQQLPAPHAHAGQGDVDRGPLPGWPQGNARQSFRLSAHLADFVSVRG